MKLRTTLGAGVATAITAATLSCLGAPALAAAAPAPWDKGLSGSPLGLATTADGATAVVLVDGGQDPSTGNSLPDSVQWQSVATGAVTNTVTLPTSWASAVAVAPDGTVAVVGEAGDADQAGLWTIAPGTTAVTATPLSGQGSDAGAITVKGDIAVIAGDDNGASVLWSLALDDLADVSTTTLLAADPNLSPSSSGVGIADDGTVYAAVNVYDYTTQAYTTQLWQVTGIDSTGAAGATATDVATAPYSAAGLAIGDGRVQVALDDMSNNFETHLLTYDPSTQVATDRDLDVTGPWSVSAFGDQVLVATNGGDDLVPATGTASYTDPNTLPIVQFDAGIAQNVAVGANELIGATSWDSTQNGPGVFTVTAPAAPAAHVTLHGTAATVSWAQVDPTKNPSADGGASLETYSVQATDTTTGSKLSKVTETWEQAFDGSGISFTVRGLVAGHHYTFSATQDNGLYSSAAGSASATVPLPVTAAPSKVSVAGTPIVGKKLTVRNTGAWATGAHLTYAWYANTTKVGTGASYTPTASAAGKKIKVAVTGTLAGHTATTRTSAAVGPVQKPVYVVKAKVTVTGTPKVGDTLTAHIGTLPKGAKVMWVWGEGFGQYGGMVKGPSKSNTYKIPASGKGGQIIAIATVTVPGYSPGEAASKPTAVVKK